MLIQCKDLIKIYSDEERKIQVPALRGCDFSVERGEMISIVGPSGSGKTTLVNILAGLESISSGEVVVDGMRLEKLDAKQLNKYRLKEIGIVDQFPERTLFLRTTVKDNVHFAYTLTYGDTPTTGERNRKILEKLGIDHLESRIVRTLSGGEMTRVAIACALAKNAPLLLCDEPTGQLDSINTEKIKELLKEITQEYSTTVLVVTHDLRFLEGVDKTYEIRDGRLSSILTKEEREIQQSFPLRYKSHIDSSRNTRIPDTIYKSLKLDQDVEFLVSEETEVSIKHPDGVPPERIVIQEYKERRKELQIDSLPEKYHRDSSIDIQLRNVSKNYYYSGGEIKALSNINLDIYKGELIFVVGPSGSGKTTLIKTISGLEPTTEGKIKVLGKPFSELSDGQKAEFRRENIGLVSQQGNLHPYLTVLENFFLKDIFSGKEIDVEINNEQLFELLTRFEINHRKDSYPLEISGGELQRAFLAAIWYHSPPIVILDEPTTNLDSTLAEETMTQILKLKEELEVTLLIATHNLSILKEGTRVIELVDGQIKREGILKA